MAGKRRRRLFSPGEGVRTVGGDTAAPFVLPSASKKALNGTSFGPGVATAVKRLYTLKSNIAGIAKRVTTTNAYRGREAL